MRRDRRILIVPIKRASYVLGSLRLSVSFLSCVLLIKRCRLLSPPGNERRKDLFFKPFSLSHGTYSGAILSLGALINALRSAKSLTHIPSIRSYRSTCTDGRFCPEIRIAPSVYIDPRVFLFFDKLTSGSWSPRKAKRS